MIDRDAPLSLLRQCELLGLNRTSLYYQPQAMSEADRRLMRRIDEVHLTHPFLGARRLAHLLQRERVDVGRRHVGTLMGLMGIEAIYRKSAPAALPRATGSTRTCCAMLSSSVFLRQACARPLWAGQRSGLGPSLGP